MDHYLFVVRSATQAQLTLERILRHSRAGYSEVTP